MSLFPLAQSTAAHSARWKTWKCALALRVSERAARSTSLRKGKSWQWGTALEVHPVYSWFFNPSQQIVSAVYPYLLEVKQKWLPLCTIWKREISVGQIDWERVWSNIFCALKNTNEFILSSATCYTGHQRSIFALNYIQLPTVFVHIKKWEYLCIWCGNVRRFSSTLSDMIGKQLPMLPAALFINDYSSLGLTERQRKISLAGLTSAKR